MNKQTITTKLVQDEKEQDFLINKVIEPRLLYFTNDQEHIKKNLKKFKIEPQEVKNGRDGLKFSKRESNVVITVSVKAVYKTVYMQFLLRQGLTLNRLNELMLEPKNQRFKPIFPYLQQGLSLTATLSAEQLLKLAEAMDEENTDLDNVIIQDGVVQEKDPFEGMKVGDKVSHEDYSNEVFIIEEIDRENNVVHTSGGKNGTWSNPPELIIQLDDVKAYLKKYGK